LDVVDRYEILRVPFTSVGDSQDLILKSEPMPSVVANENVLNEREAAFAPATPVAELAHPSTYILVKLNRTKAVQFEGLEKNVLPLVPLEHTLTITHRKCQKSIKRKQPDITPS
jgi:hypothetical protein